MPPRFGGAPQCQRCGKSVYMAEQVMGPGGQWHKDCLNCIECNQRLDSSSLREKNNEAYCKVCYNRQWGPKGYGFASGAAFLSTETKLPREILEEKNLVSPRSAPAHLPSDDGPPSIPSKPVSLQNKPALPPRISQHTLNSPVTTPEMPPRPINTAHVNTPAYVSNRSNYTPRKMNFQSQSDTCAGCGKAVYAAEMAMGAGNKYHKMCLKCTECGQRLNSTNMVDKDYDLYCRGCHSKLFGPKGYGYNNLLTSEGATR